MSEIYPVDDLEWENNSVGNADPPGDPAPARTGRRRMRRAARHPERTRPGRRAPGRGADRPGRRCRLALERPARRRTENPAGAGHRRRRSDPRRLRLDTPVRATATKQRRKVYRCIESLLNLDDAAPYSDALKHLYGAETLQQAQALLNGEQRFFGLHAPGMALEGCDMHQRLLEAYGKLHAI